MIFNMTGGGTSLNFEVVAYATENELNADTPRENTIGVVTTEPITGWYFSTTQPENMQPGEVWIATEKSSNAEFNALKKNNLTIYPVSAWQMSSGNLVSVPCKCFQDGNWDELWDGTLFDKGNRYETFTGGWESKSGVYMATTSKVAPTIGDTLLVAGTGSSNCSTVTTKNKIDLTGFRAIKFNVVNVKLVSSSGGIASIHESEQCNILSQSISSVNLYPAGEHAIDISSINKECFISIGVNNARMAEVDKIWLVR